MTHRRTRAAGAWILAVLALALAPAAAATVDGRLAEPGIVWIDDPAAVRPTTVEIRNTGKAFVPSLLVVPVGSTVRFPNDDPFFHSIFSASDADPFDIGFYPAGPGKEEVFTRSGVLDVRCHIHALMHANIVVVDGPYANVQDAFSLAKVGAGRRVLHAWSPNLGGRTIAVDLGGRDAFVVLRKPL